MSTTQVFSCLQHSRVARLKESSDPKLNGIDYLELISATKLEVFFVRPIDPSGDWRTMVRIEGGVRFPAPTVVTAKAVAKRLTVTISGPTDASDYVLKLVSSPLSDTPPANIDPILSSVTFSFRSMCPSDFDCAPVCDCEDEVLETPAIDYLAKDYNSFRQLMLDRLALLMPDGVEQSPADLQVALVEVLAYAADYLSYAQDAAATEAYLGTARLRTSLRRHARHLDYEVDEGQNARAWVHLKAVQDGKEIPAGTALLTQHEGLTVLDDDAYTEAVDDGHLVFETMEAITPAEALNEMELYTWGDRDCCLAKGSTAAALKGKIEALKEDMVLLLEEIRSPETDELADADKDHRHVVRLTKVDPNVKDLIDGTEVTTIEWSVDDALPFSLLLESKETGSATVVARGNMVLADHGMRVTPDEELDDPATDGRIRLRQGPVTRAARAVSRTGLQVRGDDNKPLYFDPTGPASLALDPNSGITIPEIELIEANVVDHWLPQYDLLSTSEYTREFVVESETGGLTWLRFGDGTFGMERPENDPDEDKLKGTYRVGNGTLGNVGADTITHIYGPYTSIEQVRNPLPAKGGRNPESAESIRTYAPLAFQTQQRAVTEADYTTVLGWHPDVQRAKALRRWTGSWYTMVVLVDRKGGKALDEDFKAEIVAYLERFRMAGIDIEVAEPVYVPLDIAMTVCVQANSIRSEVKRALLKTFSTATGEFFDPDAWTFHTDVALSAVIERAMRVTGVSHVDFSSAENRFQRYGRVAANEIADGVILVGDTEVARLDNSVLFPEYGRIDFLMEGGR